jgi:phosphoenolpyruvate carboxylase
LVKADANIHAYYDAQLIPPSAVELVELGRRLREELSGTITEVLQLKGQQRLLEGSDSDRLILRAVQARWPYIDSINLIQAELLKVIRERERMRAVRLKEREDKDDPFHDQHNAVGHVGVDDQSIDGMLLMDTLGVSIQAIAAGMQNTG